MSQTRNTKKSPKPVAKTHPVPTRFDAPEDTALAELKRLTGLTKAEIVRRAGRLAFPKFLSGEVSLLSLPTPAAK